MKMGSGHYMLERDHSDLVFSIMENSESSLIHTIARRMLDMINLFIIKQNKLLLNLAVIKVLYLVPNQ